MSQPAYRDLNKNGRLDVYEDVRRPIGERVEDLLAQMTLAEKAGMMFHAMIDMRRSDEGGLPIFAEKMVVDQRMNHFNMIELGEPRATVAWVNRLQKMAEETRLGIPVTLSSDPRHGFSENVGASFKARWLSAWPEPIGLAAIGDAELTQRFGDIARQEYVALGIRVALHPMADLATEPRWARILGTFGEDADLSAQLTAAYIRGFQGESVGPHSVACMTKHFPGGGPQLDGEDPHFAIGKEQVYPGNNFDYHLKPFEAAFAAGTSQIMPYYGMPIDTPYEEVGFGFNHGVITGLLRGHYGFEGIVCTDWRLLTDMKGPNGEVWVEAKCWGVESLSVAERARKALEAGVDQFGGESCPEVIIELVERGEVSEERLDQSVRRLLTEKFKLGLFDNPYLDAEQAAAVVGNPAFRAAGQEAQRRSIVVLKRGDDTAQPLLPLQGRPKLYVENVDPAVASAYGDVVDNIDAADLAILRLSTAYEPRQGFLESRFHSGDLDFKGEALTRILDILDRVPTVVDIFLERPAVIPEISERCAALLANFGAEDAAVLDVIFGRCQPTGKLPFELPRSMDAVRGQKEDLPYDSVDPLYAFGFGLGY